MLPFTNEMYEMYIEYKMNKQLYNLEKEYNYAITHLNEKNKDVNMLKDFISDMMNDKYSEYEQKMISEFKKCIEYEDPDTLKSITKTDHLIKQFREM